MRIPAAYQHVTVGNGGAAAEGVYSREHKQMAETLATELINRQKDWLEPLADTVQQAVASAYESGGEGGQKVADFLHGTWLGHPLHAAITDVPLGAWTSALVMDSLEQTTGREEFGTAADTAIAIGLAGAAVSAAAGLTDWHKTDGEARRVGLVHGLMNISGAVLYGASLAARRSGNRAAGQGLSTLGFLVAMGSAYLGGHLSYGHRIGVDNSGQLPPSKDFTPVMAEADLPEGEMRKADLEGSPILLAKRDGQIYALSNVCSHLGGPLNEGKFEGCEVQCPWHGSRFSLEDGSVVNGPAVHPQPRLQTRVANGQIEVRPA
jgi:nitrite reductase/ring-hydroxylating ferredoxin subunit/uncharacterized membrane protein